MDGIGLRKVAYLTVDELTADPELARRLPPDLAWSCHALPLAEDGGRVTVVMADPDDAEAREAVVAVLGPGSCVVRGSPSTIDVRLTEIWGHEAGRPLRLLVCSDADPLPSDVLDYAQALGALLGAQLGRVTIAGEASALAKEGQLTRCDLVMFGESCHPLIRRLLSPSSANGTRALQQNACPPAILVVQGPRLPLERILLVICGGSEDDVAVDWALRLARPSTAAVTVLAVVPPAPAMYHGLSRMEQGVAAMMTTDTALGRQMHNTARRLAECRLDGTLRLRQGAPDQQIFREVVEGGTDLIVMATKPCRWWLRQLKRDPICSLLSRVDRPVLLAEPTTAQRSGTT